MVNSYKRKLIEGLFTISKVYSIIIVAGGMAAGSMITGKYDSGEVAKSFILVFRPRERESLGLTWDFEASKLTPSDSLPPKRTHL